jgi:hypothetical protein
VPVTFQHYKIWFAVGGVLVLMIMNLRGVKESIAVISPIFLIFVVTHVIIIIYSFSMNIGNFGPVAAATGSDIKATSSALGITGMIILILRAYSMGAGTFTGIEAVSNGMNVFVEPKVKNAKKTMVYMAASLAFLVVGITISYVFYKVTAQPGKTLNAVLFETVLKGWGKSGAIFVLVTLAAEAALLFVAAQTGFIGGPAIIANMARDKWLPTRFALLSDRLVAHNGMHAHTRKGFCQIPCRPVFHKRFYNFQPRPARHGRALVVGQKKRKALGKKIGRERSRPGHDHVHTCHGNGAEVYGRRMDNGGHNFRAYRALFLYKGALQEGWPAAAEIGFPHRSRGHILSGHIG